MEEGLNGMEWRENTVVKGLGEWKGKGGKMADGEGEGGEPFRD